MSIDDFEEAATRYEAFRESFYNKLAHYDTWEEYLAVLNQSIAVRYNADDEIEQYLKDYYINILTKRFLAKNPFLEPYAKRGQDFFIMESEGGAVKVRVELFNIKEEDLHYPTFKEVISVHSAKHSLAMFVKEGLLNPVNRGEKFALYMRPLTTHPGDREFTHYYLSTFNFPHIILTRMENLSWLLQVNGLMKQSQFGGRWCTKIFKVEPSTMLYRRFFFSWRYSFSIDQLKEYCNKYGILYKSSWSKLKLISVIDEHLSTRTLFGESLPPPNLTTNTINKTKYSLYKWNQENSEWAETDTLTNTFPVYDKITKKVGNSTRLIGWRLTDQTLQVDNITELLGMNKFHSKRRQMMNPNITLSPKSRIGTNFLIYVRLPLYSETPKQMKQIIAKAPLHLEENPFEREHPLAYQALDIETDEIPEIEERFGCIICPYRPLEYFRNLARKYPWEYFYCMSIRLIASAKNIINEGREYWYEGKEPKNPIMYSQQIM
jgi:hypothetical protein